MDTPFPVCCTNCHDKQLMCLAHRCTKGKCYQCIIDGLQCLFPPNILLHHGSLQSNMSQFQRNCIHCTGSHQRCVFDANSPSQCKRCTKLQMTCLFKLSTQGRRNDLITSSSTDSNNPIVDSCVDSGSVNANESVQYHHPHDGDSCHGRVD